MNESNPGKPWYKRWWVWILAIVLIIFFIGFIGGSSDDKPASSTSSNATGHKTTNQEKGATKTSHSTLTVDYENYDVSDTHVYTVNYVNADWDAAKVKVDKVTIYKLSEPHKYESANDGNFKANGFAQIHFTIKANRDIEAYPTQGTIVYGDGEQHEADSAESWDGEISKGVIKSGNVTIPIQKLSKVTSLTTLRFKFDAYYDTDNIDDDNSDHKYDFTLNLQ
ncbi:hypothetical protein GPK34_00025 [Secundilactobacillus kimchicus]|uniref:hypothetical protein n=1 Tax=Secundilactobacillus kimchicus TaxID=528209 RepID=UPI001C023E37|nr:hypothetical protein [Secundilactobacillus kimchicus]MBT9670422.1 hypothetical protein [Secundilactobacillus kimchicus]